MKSHVGMRFFKLLSVIGSVFALLVVVAGGTGTAHAAPRSVDVSHVIEVARFGMTYNCASAPNTPTAKAALKKYHLCGYSASAPAAKGPTPETTIVGDCGDLSLYMFNLYNGSVEFAITITSTEGPLTYASYSGTWYNYDTGGGGNLGATGVGWFDPYTNNEVHHTNHGYVFGILTYAFDTPIFGGYCTNNGDPWDSVYA